MLNGFLTIFQFLWPFLKEALFGNDSFKAWFRTNYMTVIWFVMMLIMLLLVLALTNMLKSAESDLGKEQQANLTFQKASLTMQSTNDQLTRDNKDLRSQIDHLKRRCTPVAKPPPPHEKKTPPRHSDTGDDSDENDAILRQLHNH